MNLLTKPCLNLLKAKSVKNVIMGHTHHSITTPDGYFNPGSWIRSSKTFSSRQVLTYEILRDKDKEFFDYNLNYIKIDTVAQSISFNNYRNSK